MTRFLLSISLFLVGLSGAFAQIQYGGEPLAWQRDIELTPMLELVLMKAINLPSIIEEDLERDAYKEFGFRFGIDHAANLTTENSGQWETLANGDRVWRVVIVCPDALSIALRFGEFEMPAGGEVFVYDTHKTHFIGALTQLNNKPWKSLALSQIYSDKIVVELHLDKKVNDDTWKLSIDQITHGYRPMRSSYEEIAAMDRGPFGNSGGCNIGINCPEGAEWQCEKKSVALITSGGSAVCSGALINNTDQDGTPYFLTANHCLGGENNWVFYFNHESPSCTGNTGPTNQSISGSSLVANNGGSDFGLLELSSTPPPSYDVVYAGWDNSDALTVTSATGIHHPSGDLKKICHEFDAPSQDFVSGSQVWYISEWEEGVTEGGSSGSPLFDQNHRIIGQLYGGYAACSGQVNNGEADWYGRFGVSWDGTNSGNRLRDWLDPSNSGVTSLDPYPNCGVTYAIDAQAQALTNIPEALCSSENVVPQFTLKNNGTEVLTSCTISYTYNGGAANTIDWTGNLVEDATELIILPALTPVSGLNTVTVSLSNPNGQVDENSLNNSLLGDFMFSVGQTTINLSLLTDDYGYETYWEIREPNGSVLASGGNTLVGPDGGGAQNAGGNDPGAYPDNTLIEETINFWSWGCYEFFIVDDWGDGICCAYGDGYYSIVDGDGDLMAAGDEFGETESKQFGMELGLSIEENVEIGSLSIYPNPSNGHVQIDLPPYGFAANVTIHDPTGRRVFAQQLSATGGTISLDLQRLSAGTYFVKVVGGDSVLTNTLILR